MNADKNEPDGSFPERTKRKKPRRPRPSAAGKRVSPRPAWLTERPAVRVRKDLAAFFEFFTPLHFCVARPAQLVAPARLRKCVTIFTGSTLPALQSERRPIPAETRSCTSPTKDRNGISMLYDSTKILLQSILRSLETVEEAGWDDQTESGTSCLYEMHQMSGSLYQPYRADRLNANSRAQSGLPEKLNRAIPHVRTMVIAIRHKDQARALESGKAALAEMNGAIPPIPSGFHAKSMTGSKEASGGRKHGPVGKRRLLAEDQPILASGGD